MDAAVVELDPLADAVRTAAEDDDLLLRRRRRVASLSDSYVEYRYGVCADELRGARVDARVDRDARRRFFAERADLVLASCRRACAICASEKPRRLYASELAPAPSSPVAIALLGVDDALESARGTTDRSS